MTLALTNNTLLISGIGAGATAIVGIIVRAAWARIRGASDGDSAGDLTYYVSQKKISADDAAKILAAAGGPSPNVGEVAFYVADKKMTTGEAVKLLSAAGAGSGDINEMAYSVAQKKVSADEAAKELLVSDPRWPSEPRP